MFRHQRLLQGTALGNQDLVRQVLHGGVLVFVRFPDYKGRGRGAFREIVALGHRIGRSPAGRKGNSGDRQVHLVVCQCGQNLGKFHGNDLQLHAHAFRDQPGQFHIGADKPVLSQQVRIDKLLRRVIRFRSHTKHTLAADPLQYPGGILRDAMLRVHGTVHIIPFVLNVIHFGRGGINGSAKTKGQPCDQSNQRAEILSFHRLLPRLQSPPCINKN